MDQVYKSALPSAELLNKNAQEMFLLLHKLRHAATNSKDVLEFSNMCDEFIGEVNNLLIGIELDNLSQQEN